MKINFDTILKDLEGNPMVDEDIFSILNSILQKFNFMITPIQIDDLAKKLSEAFFTNRKKMTLKSFAINSLLAIQRDEMGTAGEEKAKRGLLAFRIQANSEIDLTVEEIAEIKKMIGKIYGPLIVFQTWNLLEGRSPESYERIKKEE